MVKWESRDSNNKIKNDCLMYFFLDKINFIRNISPMKKIYACYVSKSGFSYRDNSENKINLAFKFPGLKTYLLTPLDLLEVTGRSKDEKEFKWLKKLYIKSDE